MSHISSVQKQTNSDLPSTTSTSNESQEVDINQYFSSFFANVLSLMQTLNQTSLELTSLSAKSSNQLTADANDFTTEEGWKTDQTTDPATYPNAKYHNYMNLISAGTASGDPLNTLIAEYGADQAAAAALQKSDQARLDITQNASSGLTQDEQAPIGMLSSLSQVMSNLSRLLG